MTPITINFAFLIVSIVVLLPVLAKPYSKYGRTCGDIGCPSYEVCVMAYESCNYGARENTDCGRYPTCKKRDEASKAQTSDVSNRNVHGSSDNVPKLVSTPTRSEGGDIASFFSNSDPRPNASSSLYPKLPSEPSSPVQPQYPRQPTNYPGQPSYPRQPSINPAAPSWNPSQPNSFSNVNSGGYVPPGYGGGSNSYGGYNPYGGQPSNLHPAPQRPASIPIPPRGTGLNPGTSSDSGILSSLSGYLGGGGNTGSGISTSDVAGIIGGVINNRGSFGGDRSKPVASSNGPVDGILSGITGYLGGNSGSTPNQPAQPAAGNKGGSTFDSIFSGVSGYLGSGGNSNQGQSQVNNVIGGLIGGNKGQSTQPSDIGNVIGGFIGNRGSFGGTNNPSPPQNSNTDASQNGGVLSGIGDFLKNNAGSFISSAINGGGVSQREIITNKKNFGLFSETPSSSSNSDLATAASNRSPYPAYPTQVSAYRGNFNYNSRY